MTPSSNLIFSLVDPPASPPNLIYGLVDPRTLLIRYVGLSSRGLDRPRAHRRPSCPDTYCRRWVKTLEQQGLTYEIVVLEVIDEASKLPAAECWWIAYGRACGWPLTNLTNGGGPSEQALLEKRRRKQAAIAEMLRREQAANEAAIAEKLRRMALDEGARLCKLKREAYPPSPPAANGRSETGCGYQRQ